MPLCARSAALQRRACRSAASHWLVTADTFEFASAEPENNELGNGVDTAPHQCFLRPPGREL
jgi:hypothetical protein